VLKFILNLIDDKSTHVMKKIRMIVSGALAFKSPDLNAFQCVNNVCKLKHKPVDPNGVEFHLTKGAVTNITIDGLPCINRCDTATNYSLE